MLGGNEVLRVVDEEPEVVADGLKVLNDTLGVPRAVVARKMGIQPRLLDDLLGSASLPGAGNVVVAGDGLDAIEALAAQVIAANPGPAEDFKAGKVAALNFLKGQVMKLSKGKANPQVVGDILLAKLSA